ncbi:MAG: c-type cytochrome domain-containing protein [Planctomycetaceae bacterium]|nr:c-type cytochrome domain-containing protein [Planctomycetaceae bacterium]
MTRSPMLTATVWCLAATLCAAADAPPDFNRDVRPILSQTCFKCHGPDDGRRESGTRLDQRDSAVALGESGKRIIVPGQPDASELIRRIESSDPDVMMPPPATHLTLTAAQKLARRAGVAGGGIMTS